MPGNALFDPGFAPYVYSFTENIDAIDTIMHTLKTPHQRKFKFQILKPQIIALVENAAAFYLGCLMWAKHLKEDFPENEIVIENNPFYGVNLKEKNITEEDFCLECDSLINYFDKFEKDCKFYLGTAYHLPSEYKKIAEIYKEFLLINKSFVNVKYTSDLSLPANIDEIIKNSNSENCETISGVIQKGSLSLLLAQD